MSLASTFEEKVRIINDIWSKMAPDEKKLLLKRAIKDDIKAFFETIWEEQKFLEKETGVDGAELLEFTSEKAWNNGEEVGLEADLPGKVSKEAENAYYCDDKKKSENRYDGFLGYINSSANSDEDSKFININTVSPNGITYKLDLDKLEETVLEPDKTLIKEIKE